MHQRGLYIVSPTEHTESPVSLFYSYSHKDESLREKLQTHLSLLKDQGVIQDWHDRRIEAGTEWDGLIDANLQSAGIILLLVSADFLSSGYCRDVEIRKAMERHEAGTARVIPVILRPVDGWNSAPFGKLQALPKNAKAVTTWKNRDEAFADVARGIREAAASIVSRRSVHDPMPPGGGPSLAAVRHPGASDRRVPESVSPPGESQALPPPAKKSPVVISLHGIKTRGKWQKELAPVLADAGFIPVLLDYGNFLALQLLLPWSRRRKIDWFRDEYQRVCVERGVTRPSIVAHSFGTYLVARAMQIYETVEFDRVILCGAIVHRDYRWTDRFRKGQLHAVLNDFGRMDFWAGIVAWVVSDAGQSGRKGFTDLADGGVSEVDHPEFRHGDYFFLGNYEKSWIPFLRGEPQKRIAPVASTPVNWRYRFTSFFVLMAVIGLVCFYGLRWASSPKGLQFNTVYENLCPPKGSPDLTALSPILEHLHEPISWEGVVVATSSGGGSVYTFTVKPLDAIEDNRTCKKVTVFPAKPIDIAFFGANPSGVKVSIKGKFDTFDTLNGVNITNAIVQKLK